MILIYYYDNIRYINTKNNNHTLDRRNVVDFKALRFSTQVIELT